MSRVGSDESHTRPPEACIVARHHWLDVCARLIEIADPLPWRTVALRIVRNSAPTVRVVPARHTICQTDQMRVGPLYEQAVKLSPRAARIAAALLVRESTLPEPLRRSLTIALHACSEGVDGPSETREAGGSEDGSQDREIVAAVGFVEACRILCARG